VAFVPKIVETVGEKVRGDFRLLLDAEGVNWFVAVGVCCRALADVLKEFELDEGAIEVVLEDFSFSAPGRDVGVEKGGEVVLQGCSVPVSVGVTGIGSRQILRGDLLRGPRSILGVVPALAGSKHWRGDLSFGPPFRRAKRAGTGDQNSAATSLALLFFSGFALALADANTRFKS
jgi:hypothetical protein